MPLDDEDSCYMCEGKGVADCSLEYGGRHPESCPACGGTQKVAPCPSQGHCGSSLQS